MSLRRKDSPVGAEDASVDDDKACGGACELVKIDEAVAVPVDLWGSGRRWRDGESEGGGGGTVTDVGGG